MKSSKKISIILSFLFISSLLLSSLIKISLIETSVNNEEENEERNEEVPKISLGEIYELRIIDPPRYEPYSDGEVYSKLYDFTINISVNVESGDGMTIPNVTIWKSRPSDIPDYYVEIPSGEQKSEIQWYEMEGSWSSSAGWYNWNFTFDPIILLNGYYGISFFLNSTLSSNGEFINSSWCYFINNPPNMEIINPLDSTIIKRNENLTIQCNVTNEEAINSVEWDITDTIGIYNWKPMSYNISSEFYESIINMTDYDYGNYYLAINSTDDKNSSVLLKPLSFIRSSSPNIIDGDDDDDDDETESWDFWEDFFFEIWWLPPLVISSLVCIGIVLLYHFITRKKIENPSG